MVLQSAGKHGVSWQTAIEAMNDTEGAAELTSGRTPEAQGRTFLITGRSGGRWYEIGIEWGPERKNAKLFHARPLPD